MWQLKFLAVSLLCVLVACSPKPRTANEIYIGTITGPETKLIEVAKKVAAQRYGLKLTIISFEDYVIPNAALAEGEIDANMFQHQPYLDVILAKKKYAITPIGKMFLYPMGLYSKKYSRLQDLPPGATIAIPNDPSNGARALRLLAQAKLIEIPQTDDLSLTPKKILNSHLIIKEIAAPQLPRLLSEVDAAIINTNYALPAGLTLEQAIYREASNSPYANLVVIREADTSQLKYQQLMKALHSPEVVEEAKKIFAGQAIAAW